MPSAVPEDPEIRRGRQELVDRIMYELTRRTILEQVARGEIIHQEGISTEPEADDTDAPIPGLLDLYKTDESGDQRGAPANNDRNA